MHVCTTFTKWQILCSQIMLSAFLQSNGDLIYFSCHSAAPNVERLDPMHQDYNLTQRHKKNAAMQ